MSSESDPHPDPEHPAISLVQLHRVELSAEELYTLWRELVRSDTPPSKRLANRIARVVLGLGNTWMGFPQIRREMISFAQDRGGVCYRITLTDTQVRDATNALQHTRERARLKPNFLDARARRAMLQKLRESSSHALASPGFWDPEAARERESLDSWVLEQLDG